MKEDFNTVELSEADFDEYATDIVEGWDMDSLVQFAVDTIYSECQKMYRDSKSSIVREMVDFYGEDWLRKKKLQSFE